MKAMILLTPKAPLELRELPIPKPRHPHELLIQIEACGVCRTDLHIFDGELPHPKLPLILGHQIVGKIVKQAKGPHRFPEGLRVGVPWLGRTCDHCSYCLRGEENLCDTTQLTGYNFDGGFAEYCIADERFIFPIPEDYSPIHAAPLLCAGLIGYRSLRLAGNGKKIGFYGFGAAAHILIQVAHYQHREVYAFTRPGDEKGQEFAKKLGAAWAGGSDQEPPVKLDSAIIFAPAGELIPIALKAVRKGGAVICAGIHMSDIPSFPYSLLYGERVLRSVTNLTREDGSEFFNLLAQSPIETTVTPYPLERANDALQDLKEGRLNGSAVLEPVQKF